MRQQYNPGRHVSPPSPPSQQAQPPQHIGTYSPPFRHTQPHSHDWPPYIARPLLAPCVPPLRDTRTLHRHCSNLQPLRPALPQPHTGPTPSRYLGPPRRHRAPPSAGHCLRRALPRLSAGLQRSNSPSQRSHPIQSTPLPPHAGPHRPDASAPPRRHRAPPRRRAQKNPALRAGPIHLSVIFQLKTGDYISRRRMLSPNIIKAVRTH